ncbi:hypothetical protein ABH903_000726 [Brevibacterium epidermidis]|jgi:hypothetical protein|uniref:Uncharacterized protein n=1 Tax=Brevibacterium epidermidis TaxID=1698 RepID=A0ABV4EGS9_BREEP
MSVPIGILFDMVRKVTPAQFKAAVNKMQRQQKQAVDKYNREARRHNAAVKKAVGDYNREVRAYNAKARAHNAHVRNQRRRLEQEIRRLNSRPAARTFVTYRSSVETLAHTYTETEESLAGRTVSPAGRDLLDRGSEEAANSAYLLNAMDGDGATEEGPSYGRCSTPTSRHSGASRPSPSPDPSSSEHLSQEKPR